MDGSIYGGLLIRENDKNSCDYSVCDKITARLALSQEVLEEAWNLRHAAYSSHGFIEPKTNGMFMDDWDFRDSTRVIVVYKNEVPVATVRVCLYAPETGIDGAGSLPTMDRFRNEIVDILDKVRVDNGLVRAAEVLRLSRHPDLGADYEPVFALFRMVGYMLLHFDADAVFSAVRRHHIAFYRRMGFRKITEPCPSAKLKFETGLMACVRQKGAELRDSLSVLGLVSKADDNYRDFLAGERVPVFGTGPAPAALSGMFGGRFEGIQASPALFASRARKTARLPEIQLAA